MEFSTSMSIVKLAVLLLCCNQNVFSEKGRCSDEMFECVDGTCLNVTLVCDGHKDCVDGRDEVNCDFILCRAPNWFRCDNKRCLGSSFVCDGDNDCGDWSDEREGCTPPPVTGTPPLYCEENEFRCKDGFCVPSIWECDGKHDCPDYSDEHEGCNATTKVTSLGPRDCRNTEWRCTDGFCIPKNWVCDGKADCPDDSDENIGCASKIAHCDGFRCDNHECIPTEFHCDGSVDCSDFSDEKNCTVAKPQTSVANTTKLEECDVHHGHFLCSDAVTCLPLSEFCNNIKGCIDGGDEGGLCNTLMCKTAKCSHTCQPRPQGPLCLCPPGFELGAHSDTECLDINECDWRGVCDQRCHNLPGTHACACDEGYTLDLDDRKSCVADGEEGVLVYSSYTEIRMLTLRTEHMTRVQRRQKRVTGVAFDGQRVFWSSLEEGEERIMRSREDGSKKESIVTAGVGMPEDMAWDWVTEKLYFTDALYKHVAACTDNGHLCTVLVNTVTDMPRGIVVLPQDGTMYWADWGKKPHIAKAGMDGSKPELVVTEKLYWPNSVAVDYSNQRLYWADAKFHTLESAKLDGSDRRTVLKSSVTNPFSIAVFENRLYWSDVDGHEIRSCDKFTGKARRTLVRETKQRILGIHIYHPALHPELPNPCSTAPCSHMCLLNPQRLYTCACPNDMELSKDRTNCKSKDHHSFMFVSGGNKIFHFEHQTIGRQNITETPLQTVSRVGAIAFNYRDEHVLLSDTVEKKIVSMDTKSLTVNTLIDSQLGIVTAMDYDPLGHNLYWCDSERQTVEVLSLTTHERAMVLHDLEGQHPLSMVLLPEDNLMILGVTSEENNHIDTYSMSGRNHTHLIEGLHGRPVALTYHHHLKRIFWTDDLNGVIESADINGNKRVLWRSVHNEPASLALIGTELFYTSSFSPYLHWAELDTTHKISQLKLNVDMLTTMHMVVVTHPHPLAVHQHNCRHQNGGCTHVCLTVGPGTECGCPAGMHLKKNEKTCISEVRCQRNEFLCKKDDICIPIKHRCDGRRDCPSGDDEKHCDVHTCAPDFFTCTNGDCVLEHLHCDGKEDCRDGSDEILCKTKKTCDNNDQFTCDSGECLDRSFVCDGSQQCKDGSDENNCEFRTCSEKEFACRSGSCVPASWECDGQPDCDDASDEHSACVRHHCKADDFKCANGKCVDRSLFCDGEDDCGDGSDEVCDVTTIKKKGKTQECPKRTHFRCDASPHICLPESARCNGTTECPHHEDEMDCGCPDGTFACRDSVRCIADSWVCDGFKDCGDGSDEDSCNVSTTAAPSARSQAKCDEFSCASTGECLRFSQVCDRHNDCADGSDEGGRCGSACGATTDNPCFHICHKTPSGPVCRCQHGFELSSDTHTCTDVNECERAEGSPCSQMCRNTEGSFICGCDRGYRLIRADRRSCKAEGPGVAAVFATKEELRKLSLYSQDLDVLASHTGLLVSGIATDARKSAVYWSTGISGRVTRLNETTGLEEQLEGLVERPQRLAIDWSTDNIYVVDNTHYPSIKVCSMELSRCAKIFTATGASDIAGLVVDPLRGQMFWAEVVSERGAAPRSEIWQADMDGQNSSVVVGQGLLLVSGLDVDLVQRQLYWADQSRGIIETANMDGKNRRTLPFHQVTRPLGVFVFESFVFWMDGGSGKLSKCELRFPHVCDHVELHAYDTQHFALMQQALQPPMVNGCQNSSCSHLCVLKAQQGTSCLCEDGSPCKETLPSWSAGTAKASSGASTAMLAALFMTVLLLAVAALTWYIAYYRRGNKGVFDLSLHFQNAGFGLPHHVETSVLNSADRINPGEHHYVNPVFRTAAAAGEKLQNSIRRLSRSPQQQPPSTASFPLEVQCSSPAPSDDSDCESLVDSNHRRKLIPVDK